ELRTVIISTHAGEPVGVLPLALTREPALPLGIRKLRSLANYYTSAFELIPLNGEFVPEMVQELAACLAGMGREANFIELEPMARDGRFFDEAGAAFGQRGYVLAPYRRFSNWFHEVHEQTFDEYFRSRDSALRNTYI